MQLHDLGPLMVETAGATQACAGPRQAAILAMLAMNANRRVPVDELVVAAWGYDAQVSSSSVENQIWRLRRLIEPRRRSRSAAVTLLNEHGGYRLVTEPEDLDSLQFERLAEQARGQLEHGDPGPALDSTNRALRLWRGTPYEPIAHTTLTSAVVARLDEIRGQVLERRIAALLDLGDAERAVADLEVLTAELPFREQLWSQQMTALSRLGRTEEALGAYQRVRTLMLDELGLEPGAGLRELHRAVLAQEHSTSVRSTPLPPRGRIGDTVHLPTRSTPLIGRDVELATVARLLPARPLVTVTGPGGCGKTRLVIDVARSEADRFPDGVWFIDLTELSAPASTTGPGSLVDMIVSRLSLRGEGGSALQTLVSSVLESRILLVLDNCEHVLDAVAKLVEDLVGQPADGPPGWAILATSREPIDVDGEATVLLQPLPLVGPGPDPGATSPAAALFIARAMIDRRDELDADEIALVERICRAVDGLPLAIELAAGRAHSFTLAEIAEQVESDPSRLGRIGRASTDHRRTLWSAIEWSHDLVSAEERVTHRRLSVLPGSFTLPAAAAVVGKDVEIEELPGVLARLVHRSLLVVEPPRRRGRPTMFHQLETVRAHARRHLEEASELPETTGRRDRWVRQLLARRPRLGRPEEASWYDTVEDVYPAVRASLESFLTAPVDPEALVDGTGLLWYWYYRTKVHEGERWLDQAVRLAGPGPASVLIRMSHASSLYLLNRGHEGRPVLELALVDLDATAGHEHLLAVPLDRLIEAMVGLAGSTWTVNEFALMRQVTDRLMLVAQLTHDADLDVVVAAAACASRLDSEDLAAVARDGREVYDRAVALGNLCALWEACAVLNIVALLTSDVAEGLLWTDRVIDAHRQLGSGGGGVYLEALANFLLMSGDPEQAVELYAAAYAHTRRAGMVWPARPVTPELFDEAARRLPPTDYERAWNIGESLSLDEVAARRRSVSEAAPG